MSQQLEALSDIMRWADAYAFDYAKHGKSAWSRAELEKALRAQVERLQAERGQVVACNNEDCGWSGPVAETCRLGSVGPLCPKCRETTEPNSPPAVAQAGGAAVWLAQELDGHARVVLESAHRAALAAQPARVADGGTHE